MMQEEYEHDGNLSAIRRLAQEQYERSVLRPLHIGRLYLIRNKKQTWTPLEAAEMLFCVLPT